MNRLNFLPSNNLRHTALLVLFLGGLLLAIVFLMQLQGPQLRPHVYPNKQGFSTAMVWIELALGPREFFEALAPVDSPEGRLRRKTIDAQNRIDFAFMAVYSLYTLAMFFFLMLLHQGRGTPLFSKHVFFYTGLILAPVMFVGDLFETHSLFAMTSALGPAEIPEGALGLLIVFTRIKWVALFVSLLLVALSYAAYFGPSWKLLLPFCLVSGAFLGLTGSLVPSLRFMVEPGSLLLAMGWLSVLVHAVLVYRRGLGFAGRTARANRM